jgi:hypothetical protein
MTTSVRVAPPEARRLPILATLAVVAAALGAFLTMVVPPVLALAGALLSESLFLALLRPALLLGGALAPGKHALREIAALTQGSIFAVLP